MELNKEKLLKLYPNYTSVLGPYSRPDGRQHVVLNNSALPKGSVGKTKTISYPKALVESSRGSKLKDNETVDHDNRFFEDNTPENLIVRDLIEHAILDAKRVDVLPVDCPYCMNEFVPTKDQSKNRKIDKAGPFCSKRCAGSYSKSVQMGGTTIGRTQIYKDHYHLDK